MSTETMTSHERFKRMYEHREADRIPVIDDPWSSTLERWWGEGLPKDRPWTDYFGLDRFTRIHVDNSPRFPVESLKETEDYRIHTTAWGVTMKDWKHRASVPQFLSHRIHDRASWEEAKARMAPSDDRIPWDHLRANYRRWREEGHWLVGNLWFGFDATHAWTVGTETVLFAISDDPEWLMDMFGHYLDVNLALLDRVWEAGFRFDEVMWPDDMGFKHNQFFSVKTYRWLLKPFHRRAIEWAHRKGIKAHLHSCGDVNPFIPELLEIGLNALNPLEVKAGMDPVALKERFGDRLVLHGGIDAVLWDDPQAIEEAMRQTIPKLKEKGGYIFSSDHSVPSSVSMEGFQRIVSLAKELGSYA